MVEAVTLGKADAVLAHQYFILVNLQLQKQKIYAVKGIEIRI